MNVSQGETIEQLAESVWRSVDNKGIARAMCKHSLQRVADRGFKAMQFNFLISSNTRAVALCESFNFEIVGRLPMAFFHPTQGYIDALVMFNLFDKTMCKFPYLISCNHDYFSA